MRSVVSWPSTWSPEQSPDDRVPQDGCLFRISHHPSASRSISVTMSHGFAIPANSPVFPSATRQQTAPAFAARSDVSRGRRPLSSKLSSCRAFHTSSADNEPLAAFAKSGRHRPGRGPVRSEQDRSSARVAEQPRGRQSRGLESVADSPASPSRAGSLFRHSPRQAPSFPPDSVLTCFLCVSDSSRTFCHGRTSCPACRARVALSRHALSLACGEVCGIPWPCHRVSRSESVWQAQAVGSPPIRSGIAGIPAVACVEVSPAVQ